MKFALALDPARPHGSTIERECRPAAGLSASEKGNKKGANAQREHPGSAGISGAQQRGDNDDLHACHARIGQHGGQSVGFACQVSGRGGPRCEAREQPTSRQPQATRPSAPPPRQHGRMTRPCLQEGSLRNPPLIPQWQPPRRVQRSSRRPGRPAGR